MAVTITEIILGEHYAGTWNPKGNAAGGFDIGIQFNNNSAKTIKYIRFIVTAYNSVGDPAVCEVVKSATRSLKLVGPIEGNTSKGGIWQTMWYNHALSSVKVDKIEIEYMDGSTETQTTGLSVQPFAAPKSVSSGGCYVATSVYGSYDCPQVWTLRRYRDYSLALTWYGRLFIALYYAISPTIVKWFGDTLWFKRMWKGKLDKMVKKLQEEGFEDTPYNDKEW